MMYLFMKLTTLELPNGPVIDKLRQETIDVCLWVLKNPKHWRGDYIALARTTLVLS